MMKLLRLISMLILLLSCDNKGILATAQNSSVSIDGSLHNNINVNNMVRYKDEFYLVGLLVWRLDKASNTWVKFKMPAGVNSPDEPAVGLAVETIMGNEILFLATSNKIYLYDGSSWQESHNTTANYALHALFVVNSTVIVRDIKGNVWEYRPTTASTGEWIQFITTAGLSDIVWDGTNYYTVTGAKMSSGSALSSLSAMSNLPWADKTVSDIALYPGTGAATRLYAISDKKLYAYTIADKKWSASLGSGNNSTNWRMQMLGENIIIANVSSTAYQIYNVPSTTWKSDKSKDDFTDNSSLNSRANDITLSSSSVNDFYFYDSAVDSEDILFALMLGSNGVFRAIRKGNRWSWARE